ncbi:MAG: hypothetical protein ACRD4Q_10680 [Candidatus Acidiferrales bacterium]
MGIAKYEAKRLIDALPDQATWDDIMYELYAKQKLEKALGEAAEGVVVPHESVKRELSTK